MENILVNIDSRFRNKILYPNSGKYTYSLDHNIKNIMYIRLSSVELPVNFYTFQSSLNNITFYILINGDSNLYFLITLKEGNYTSDIFINYLQAELNKINNSEVRSQLKIIWDTITYKVTITNNLPFTLIFGNDASHQSLGNRMGFNGTDDDYLYTNQKQTYDSTHNVYSWTGDSYLNITKENYYFIKINDYGVLYNNNGKEETSYLGKIMIYDTQIIFDNNANLVTKMYKFRQPINISKLQIELVDPYGDIVQMGLGDFSFTLELGQIYDNTIKY